MRGIGVPIITLPVQCLEQFTSRSGIISIVDANPLSSPSGVHQKAKLGLLHQKALPLLQLERAKRGAMSYRSPPQRHVLISIE